MFNNRIRNIKSKVKISIVIVKIKNNKVKINNTKKQLFN